MALIPSFFDNRRGTIFDPFAWEPFKDFPFPPSSLISHENSAFVNTRIDWRETPEAHISGERNVEKEDKNDTWHRVERSSGKFLRRFRLPENAKVDQVRASMENGVLTVTVPKEEVKKPDVKAIEISDEAPSFIHSPGNPSRTSLSLHPLSSHMRTQPLLTLASIGKRPQKPMFLRPIFLISGERSVDKEDKSDTWHRVERSSGKFLRRFRLPENAKVDQVRASMENGVLTVTVPKEEVKKPDVKAIEISELARKFVDQRLSMENWVLTVTVPKEEVKKPDVKAIEISEAKNLIQRYALLSGYTRNELYGDVVKVFMDLVSNTDFKPESFTFPFVIKACGEILDIRLGEVIHGMVIKLGLVLDVFVGNVLVGMHEKCGVVDEAMKMALIPSFFDNRRGTIFNPFAWEPFKDFPFPSSSLVSHENSAIVNTRIDWRETPEAHVFKADLPGLKKEEVKVEVEDERFLRRFRLPENAKVDQVKASMEYGVLTVTVPKEEVKKPDVKAIEISDFKPVNFTFPSVIKACGEILDVRLGEVIHGMVIKLGLVLDVFVGNVSVGMYENCGVVDEAMKMTLIPRFFDNRRGTIFDPFTWEPFKDFPFPSPSLVSHENSAFVNTRIDWKETPEAHVFKADLPGLKKEEVKVEVEDERVLQISGERNVEKEDKSDTWHRVERSSGKFLRRFRLPENAKVDQVRASMENGVLTVTVPKEEVKKPDMALIPSFFDNRRGTIFDSFAWDLFKDFPFPSSSLVSHENSAFVNTRIDWRETPEAHVFKADLPGLKKEEVKVEVEDERVLQISGERSVEKEDKSDTWHRVERSSGKFLRRFRLPENAKVDQVKASMENGVLTVTVPKEEVKKPDKGGRRELGGESVG
ncbi:hypothetical protein SADUNF_Sadunf19G0086500 [Salix dunnii]|uniref:SHSP domain-containing protein n=1 Tax=Salix dunnii TaxID=1413687 RepID=A0A835IZ42_9ROSI|nr:hypothetical protein SADUNF_Sadunf19G0086500 [Salix dunnii]